MDIKEKIGNLPGSPGVYIMKDEAGQALYVGKAINLRKRVSSYFRPSHRLSGRTESLVRKVKDIEYIPTSTSAEALIYENSLIKQLSPRYNVALKDGKTYPLLKLTANERFARLVITRTKKDDGAVYYGPYADAKLLRQALSILKVLFPLRTCKRMPKRLCLEYHIKQCLGPCEGKVDEAGYRDMVHELKLFLEGKRAELLAFLSAKMAEAARGENFEEAANLRNRIEALGAIKEKRVTYNVLNALDELKNMLGIDKKSLDRIEAFDVSNIMGKDSVGSMVYFYKGRPRKTEYRHYRIKTVSQIDDYAMMRELIKRRYSRLLEEKAKMPDLILIDGGKAHLSTAVDELKKLGLPEIPAIGIAKEFEHIYVKDRQGPILLPRESKALHLLMKIRDEAHRFAISYHKKLLSKKVHVSKLDDIEGIGRTRKLALLSHFGSIDRIITAGLKDLMKVKGIDERSAQNIIRHFKRQSPD